MFERFTPQARHVILSAQEEARRFRHDSVGTGHILLAIMREGDEGITRVFKSLGVNPESVRMQVEGAIGHGEGVPYGDVPFHSQGRTILTNALNECRRLRQRVLPASLGALRQVPPGEGDLGGSGPELHAHRHAPSLVPTGRSASSKCLVHASASVYLIGSRGNSPGLQTSAIVPLRPSVWLHFGYGARCLSWGLHQGCTE